MCKHRFLPVALLTPLLFVNPLLATEQATESMSLKQAAQAAVLKNPEVLARWHAFKEADEEIGVARGGFFPKIDLSAGSGRTRVHPASAASAPNGYSSHDRTISLRQMLFDGLATVNEVRRLGKAKLVRYFELLDASENTALEAGRAYLDVIRQRRQVYLAEENYIQHQAALEQLKRRADSGVGKRVDVDQAASRLALADVNLVTTMANLHDVTARYQRLIGEAPPEVMPPPTQLANALPNKVDEALRVAFKDNPALRATIENVEASQFDLQARRSAFMPRIDFNARREDVHNYLGYQDSYDNTLLEVRLSYNLFNGGSDLSRHRQYRERKNIALDQREKSCRDTRQTLVIAYNDTLRLTEQSTYVAQQVELVEKTRNAYRDQFNIGQRTLLDLLNTQNEYFDARRAQVNTDIDLSLAYLRSYAGMGHLLEKLGLKRLDSENDPPESELTVIDPGQLCPVLTPGAEPIDREALGRKAKALTENSPTGFVDTKVPTTAPATDNGVGKVMNNPPAAASSVRTPVPAPASTVRPPLNKP
ncbi:MAG TPA: TolC family outer membrane protein [Accumulibacter sp.]|nr:TolC family outer membrane protein [Accumulibacter sp.]HNC21489.1 TolC family outer membrane protein [Accumulibacter sp.]HNH24357.1 TolC family outer membrane protein [Accumulibacter sp.]HNI74086.1 TolC family outer membrane protein [Accumulibacter sp.]